jgi:TM2 domain-containing membrane protein YozV
MSDQLFYSISNLDSDELLELKQHTQGFSEEKLQNFVQLYKSRRKDPQTGMILGIIPFAVGIHGISRFYYGSVGMGILYVFTGGLCFIGTIIDLVNNKKMALEANRKIILECVNMSQHF